MAHRTQEDSLLTRLPILLQNDTTHEQPDGRNMQGKGIWEGAWGFQLVSEILKLEKKQQRDILRDILENTLPVLLKKCQGHKNKEGLRNCHQGHRDQKIKYNVNEIQCGILDWILKQKKGISGQ